MWCAAAPSTTATPAPRRFLCCSLHSLRPRRLTPHKPSATFLPLTTTPTSSSVPAASPSPPSTLRKSVGQIIGEVLKQLSEDKFIVKASSGPRYVVGCRNKVDKAKLVAGVRVTLDMTTLTIMRQLPREVDPAVRCPVHEFTRFQTHSLHITTIATMRMYTDPPSLPRPHSALPFRQRIALHT